MTWFALRVQRLQFLVAVAALVLFACWLVLTGTHDQAAWTALVHGGCLRNTGPPSTLQCNLLWIRFGGTDQWTLANLLILYAIPGLVGVVFGAPLVAREIERGTNRFVWTQSITRTHWLAVKLLVGGTAHRSDNGRPRAPRRVVDRCGANRGTDQPKDL